MFQFPRFPPPGLCVRPGGARAPPGGFSHSETPGSKAVCASPGTIAACRVLRRLHVPRHPPCALDIFPPRGRAAGRVPTSSNLLPQAGPRPGRGAPGGPTHLCRRLTSFSFLLQYIDGFRCTPFSGGADRIDFVFSLAPPSVRWRLVAMRLSRCAGSDPGDRTRGRAVGLVEGDAGTPAPQHSL